jgi:hypothetical protein
MTLEDMTYVIGSTKERIVVPKGFVTDFASIPRELWSFGLSPHGQYGRAAVIHDYLYWSQGCKREQADRLLVLAMKESNVGHWDTLAIYGGVDLGGVGAWTANSEERKNRLPRVVPERYLRPDDPNVLWSTYRAMLVTKHIVDPAFEQNPSYCKYGDSTNVP